MNLFNGVNMSKFLIILALSTSYVFSHTHSSHSHDSHTWSGDKEAFKYNDAQKETLKRNIEAIDHSKDSLDQDEFIAQISETYLKEKLEKISGAKNVNLGGSLGLVSISERSSSKGRELARQFLTQEYKALGYKVTEQKFGRGVNLIAEKKSTHPDAKILILTSHYDTVRTAGANDNGTGTISALGVAKALSTQNFKHTIQIVAFDKEESGLVGSKAFVKKISDKSKIIGNINYEMMGTNSRKDGVFHVIDCKRAESTFLSSEIANTINRNSLQIAINPGCTDRSDHASFWKKKIPAIVISENFFGGDSDKCYHKKCDIVDERIDFTYMKNITHAIYGAIISLLQ